MPARDDPELLARLAEVGQRRSEADRERREASAELGELIRAAKDAGVPIARIAREAQLSRQRVYDVLAGRDA